MTAPVLSVRNLTTSFRVDGQWRQVVRNLSFDIGPRETVAIVGESGSGKSVTALSAMRLLPAANSRVEGQILFDGRDLLALPEEAMRQVRGTQSLEKRFVELAGGRRSAEGMEWLHSFSD